MKFTHIIPPSLLIASLLGGCGGESKGSDSISLAKVPGNWKNELTGELLVIENTTVTTFHVTQDACIETRTPMTIEEADAYYYEVVPSNPFAQYLHITEEEGNRAEDQVFAKLDSFPEACQNADHVNSLTATQVFEHTWQTFNAYYPFFEQRNVEWDAVYQDYSGQISDDMTSEQLFIVLAEMLSAINDSHVELITKSNNSENTFNPALTQGWHRIAERLESIENVPYEIGYQYLIQTLNQALEGTYASGPIEHFTNTLGQTALAWTTLEDEIGYLQVNTFDGFKNSSDAFSVALDNFSQEMNHIMSSFNNTSGLILDLRFNRGGEHELAMALASYFADSSHVAFYTDDRYSETPSTSEKHYFQDNDIRYSKPVTIIQSSSTRGAAELLTLALSNSPTVTIAGERSIGSYSPQFSLSLTPEIELRFPYRHYLSANDQNNYEALGTPVNHESPSSSYSAIDLNILPSIHTALEMMDVDVDVSESEYENLVVEVMGDDIPGFASAQISPSDVHLHAFGYANLEAGIPVSTDTPFKLGSISKTFIGTSAMQMFEGSLIEFDASLEDYGFPIMVDGSQTDNQQITLRHLATHTSGIADGDDYFCTYVIDDGNISLTGAFDIYECPNPLSTDTQIFLSEYLQNTGIFYQPTENFTGTQSGAFWQYSNVGATTAAEVLHIASGIPFDEWTQTNIFAPLGMNDSGWFNSDFPSDAPPAQPYALFNGELIAIPRYSLATWADGDLRTSVRDLSRYLQAIVNGGELEGNRILSEESVAYMLENQTNSAVLEDQGILWFNDGTIMGHSGGDPGTMAHMYYDQYNQVGYISLLNISGEDDAADEILLEKFELLNYLTYRRGLTAFKQ